MKEILLRSEMNAKRSTDDVVPTYDMRHGQSTDHLELDLTGLVESIGKERDLK